MKTLEIKKTSSGQYSYEITEQFRGTVVPVQFGTYDMDTTVSQAKARFSFDAIRDVTECTVDVMNRDGGYSTVRMTKDAFDRTSAKTRDFAADQFVARITHMAGVPVEADSDVPF